MSSATSLPLTETFASIDSTNAEAKRRANAGQRGPIWLRAQTQSAGVGRSGREWYSPEGNLYATLLIPFSQEIRYAALISFAACIAVAETLEKYVPACRISLKWPNDALLDGKKIAGVLLEAGGEPGKQWLAIGIGINLLHKPTESRWQSIALADVVVSPSSDIVFEVLAKSVNNWIAQFETSGFDVVRQAWLSRAAHIGEKIEARLMTETIVGIFQGIGEDGTLHLATDQGNIRISAADIYFPG